MTFEAVDVYLKDTTSLHDPIVGATAKIMSQDGVTFFTLATSDSDGKISLLLESGFTYQLRFFKHQVIFPNPQYIDVLEDGDNVFDVSAEIFTIPVSTDARLCVASGTFRRPDGSPHAYVDIHFIPQFDPIILEGSALLAEKIAIRTDKNGYAQVTLIRYAKYDVTIQGFEDSILAVEVANLPNVNLPDLLFPVVESIIFDPEGPYVLAVDEILEVTPTVVTSDGRVLEGTATADVNWKSSDTSILAVTTTRDTIKFRGVTSGAANLECTRSDNTIIRIPNTPIDGVPVVVTVT